MKIIRLEAENFKRLKAVAITPDGAMVPITGRNGQGKTSILDAISHALGGGAASKDTSRPIRDGEEQAEVTIDMGDFTVTKRWTPKGETLVVASKDGARYPSPQTFLNEKLGALSFDPLHFAQQDAKSQLETLLALVELPFDPDELDNQRAAIFEERTEYGRKRREVEGQLAGMPEPPEDLPAEELSTAAIFDEQAAHQGQVTAYLNMAAQVDKGREAIEHATAEVARLQSQLREAERELSSVVTASNEVKAEFDGMTAPAEVDFGSRLAEVETTNRRIRDAATHAAATKLLAHHRSRYDELTAALDEVNAIKADALAQAKMPIDGLAFDETGVTFQGVPFKQCSSAEQLRVSMAMAVAMNPEVRVCLIRDGSLLDSGNLALIAEMAEEHDTQVWIERIDESGEVGFVIEDGTVRA